MKEFKGCTVPDGFQENIEKIKDIASGHDYCALTSTQAKCELFWCSDAKCILSIPFRHILREYLAMLEAPKPFAAGTIIDAHQNLQIMASFKDGDDLYYAVKRACDGKSTGLYIISEKKLLHDMRQCRIELVAQNKLHQQAIEENKAKIDAIDKLLKGRK